MSSGCPKSAVRQHGLSQRRNLTPEQRQAFTLRMWEHLESWAPFQQIRTLHCSLALPEEPDTTTWFERVWALGKQTVVPCMMPGTRELAHAVVGAMGEGWAVLMQNHGLLVAGRTLRRAADMTEIIERTAQVILGGYAVGKPPPVLPDEAVKKLLAYGDLMA